MVHNDIVIGIASGLILSAVLRWTPTWRELLTAAVAAVLIDLVMNGEVRRMLNFSGAAWRPAGEIPVYPHFCPCVAVAFIGILAVLHVLRAE